MVLAVKYKKIYSISAGFDYTCATYLIGINCFLKSYNDPNVCSGNGKKKIK
jgi:hypothetical protein